MVEAGRVGGWWRGAAEREVPFEEVGVEGGGVVVGGGVCGEFGGFFDCVGKKGGGVSEWVGREGGEWGEGRGTYGCV